MVDQDLLLYRSVQSSCRDLFVIDHDDEQLEVSAVFSFSDDYLGFQGHFPGRPILPAVAQLAAVRCVVEHYLKKEVKPAGYSRVKFRGMICPEQEMKVRVLLVKTERNYSADFFISDDSGESIADGSCLFID